MWGHDVQVEKKLTKREIEKLGVSTIPMETKTLPYTKESCKLGFKLSRGEIFDIDNYNTFVSI